MISDQSTHGRRNPTLPPEIARLLAMARDAGLRLTTGEGLRQRMLIDATRSDVEGGR